MKHTNINKNYHPIDENIAIGYFDNADSSFIIDEEESDNTFEYFWSYKNDNNRCIPVTTINGKHTYLSRFIMNTPNNMECDHENNITMDNRKCNLKNCTKTENLYNRKCSAGKVYKDNIFWKVSFPKKI